MVSTKHIAPEAETEAAGQRQARRDEAVAVDYDRQLRMRLRDISETAELLETVRRRRAHTLLGFSTFGSYMRDLIDREMQGLRRHWRVEILRLLIHAGQPPKGARH